MPPTDFNNIQDAIDHAEDGDTVIVEPGTYTGEGNRSIRFNGKAITVRGTNPDDFEVVAATVMDCNQHGCGFIFDRGEDANSILSGLKITNGRGGWGGVVSAEGGAVSCDGGSPVITNCILTGNTGSGGGIGATRSYLTVRNCIITHNISDLMGGGIFGRNQHNLTVENCIISHNSAPHYGGGIRITSDYPVTIKNCIITGNTSGTVGGGISARWPDIVITGCVITGNRAAQHGGGILGRQSARLIISNSIVSGNSAPLGPEIALLETRPPTPELNIYPALVPSYSNIRGGLPAIHVEEGYRVEWGPGNIDADPCFADPGYWAHKDEPNIHVEPNDPNATWVDGDYHLKSQAGRWNPSAQSWILDDATSLCIDAGDPNSDWTAELWPNGQRINLGAYGGTGQAGMSPNDIGNIADLDLDGFVYRMDIPFFVDQWLLGRLFLPADLTRDGFVDFPDLAVFAQNWRRPPLPSNAWDPSPPNGATILGLTPLLTWSSDPNTLWHDVYFGTDSPGLFQNRQGAATFEPETLDKNTWYYWRIDEMNPAGVTTGTVWSFKTASPPDPATDPYPANNASYSSTSVTLSWQPGSGATSHDVYFGTSSPGAFQGNRTEAIFNPDTLSRGNTYYWRIDEVNADGTTTGTVWKFTVSGVR